jgi:tetratricopeptide (TPR) repeat protein
MTRILPLLLVVLISPTAQLFAEECSISRYEVLVAEGKKGDETREWGKSAEAYGSILAECRSVVKDADMAKIYDALSVAQSMMGNYTEAIENAKKCIEIDGKYNACMMTAARSYENLGDRGAALEYARSAVDAGGYDEYSSAVAILAKDFLRRLEKK